MNEYLVMYTNPNGKRFCSIKVWEELKAILNKMKTVGGGIKIYRLDKCQPEQVYAATNEQRWCLVDMYKNIVEG